MELNRSRIALKTIKRCPSCHSVFITNTQCESCGLLLKPNRLKEELSKRSFYNLKENYSSEIGFIFSKFKFLVSKDNGIYKNYRRSLSKRFSLLLKYFVSNERKGLINSKQFMFEFKDLIYEMLDFDYDQNYLFDKIEALPEHPFRQELFMSVSEVISKRNNSDSILDRKLFNLIRVKFLLQAFLIYGALIYIAIKAFEKIYIN